MRTFAALLFTAAVVFAQPLSVKQCSVDGTILNSVTGAPILRAHISIVGPGNDLTAGSDVFRLEDGVTVDSDAAGRWHAELVPCGHVSITASRGGFLSFAGLPSPAKTYVLTVNNPTHDVRLKLDPQSVIAGRVFDDQGDPIVYAQVSLYASRVVHGVRSFQAATSIYTNDLGEFRFSGLAAGRYIVCAGVDFYVRQCVPGPLDGDASDARLLRTGDETNVDLTLPRAATVEVTGQVTGGPPAVRGTVALIPRPLPLVYMSLTSKVRDDGTFSIAAVPQGSYTLTATGYNGWSGQVTVEVAPGGLSGIQLRLEPLLTVTGRVHTDSLAGKTPQVSQTLLYLQSSENAILSAEWNETGTQFRIANVAPGDYRLVFSQAPFYVKSIALGGREIGGVDLAVASNADAIEIFLGDDGGAIEGNVIAPDDSGRDAPVFGWVLLQADGEPSRIITPGGYFHIDNLPPGNYRLYAWDDIEKVEYGNPDWMQRYGKGVEVTVKPHSQTRVNVVRQVAPPE